MVVAEMGMNKGKRGIGTSGDGDGTAPVPRVLTPWPTLAMFRTTISLNR